jgi:hypothetical protein
MQLDQFPVRQFALLRWANINAMTQFRSNVKMLNGLFVIGSSTNNTPSVPIFMAQRLVQAIV